MGNLNLILFISFAAPLLMSIIISKGKMRIGLSFLFIGITVCLFCGELNTIIYKLLPYNMKYFTSNFTPLIEEIFKGIPILFYAFMFKPKKKTLLECSILVGVGFAILENAFILGGNSSTVSISLALIRGFGSGMMHGLCTLNVGYGMTFVNSNRKLFYTGTFAVLTESILLHGIYNTLVQSQHQVIGFLLPVIIFIPVIITLKKEDKKEKEETPNQLN